MAFWKDPWKELGVTLTQQELDEFAQSTEGRAFAGQQQKLLGAAVENTGVVRAWDQGWLSKAQGLAGPLTPTTAQPLIQFLGARAGAEDITALYNAYLSYTKAKKDQSAGFSSYLDLLKQSGRGRDATLLVPTEEKKLTGVSTPNSANLLGG